MICHHKLCGLGGWQSNASIVVLGVQALGLGAQMSALVLGRSRGAQLPLETMLLHIA